MAWITDGESGADVRAKLNALAIPIESGTISSPVEYLDIDLPSGYDHFVLRLCDLVLGDADTVICGFSYDGGVTFISDANNGDSYTGVFTDTRAGASLVEGGEFNAAFCYVTVDNTPASDDVGIEARLDIAPGSASIASAVRADALFRPTGDVWQSLTSMFLNPAGSVPPTFARANCLRVMPYGDGDLNAPNGNEIASASYFLYGIPTP